MRCDAGADRPQSPLRARPEDTRSLAPATGEGGPKLRFSGSLATYCHGVFRSQSWSSCFTDGLCPADQMHRSATFSATRPRVLQSPESTSSRPEVTGNIECGCSAPDARACHWIRAIRATSCISINVEAAGIQRKQHLRVRSRLLQESGCYSVSCDVFTSAETWPSGRRRSPAKGVGGKPSRGFESLRLRHPNL